MSIAEFLDGLPSFDERNFSDFRTRNSLGKATPRYVTTNDQPSDQVIVSDNSHMLLKYLHQQWGKKHGYRKKRVLEEESEESGSTSRKHPRVE